MLEYSHRSSSQRSHKVIVMLVKDAQMGAFFLRALSQEKGYYVMLFSHEDQVLRILREVKPDLLLLDAAPGEHESLKLYERLQTIKGLEKVPALLSNLSTRFPSRQKKPPELQEYDEPSALESLFYTLQEILVE